MRTSYIDYESYVDFEDPLDIFDRCSTQGVIDYYDGVYENPYPLGSDEHEAWNDGWSESFNLWADRQ